MLTATRLMDSKMIQTEYGFKRYTAEAVMERCEKFRLGRRVYVLREDVERVVRESGV